MKKIAVLGTGNIAQTIAVDLKASGHEVRLFAPETSSIDSAISQIPRSLSASVHWKHGNAST